MIQNFACIDLHSLRAPRSRDVSKHNLCLFPIKEIPGKMLSRAQKLQALMELTRNNLIVCECIHRITSAVVPQRVRITERIDVLAQFKTLKTELADFIEPYFANFLNCALECMLVCGFVVFTSKQHTLHDKEIEIPVVLPLGSFLWEVRPVSKDTNKHFVKNKALYYYEITCIHHDLKPHELHIWSIRNPVPSNQIMPSRFDGILADFLELQNFEIMIRRIDEWNSMKHITTSESVSIPRDQTTDGISLLDDFRRYIMSGQHSGISSNYMVMCGAEENNAREDPSNLANSWIQNFSFSAGKGDSTCVHLLPPNTITNELGPLELKHNRDEFYKRFRKNVMGFFEITPFDEVGGQNSGNIAYEVQVIGMRRLSQLSIDMLEHVYAQTFEIDIQNVKISMPRPAMPQSLLSRAGSGKQKSP